VYGEVGVVKCTIYLLNLVEMTKSFYNEAVLVCYVAMLWDRVHF